MSRTKPPLSQTRASFDEQSHTLDHLLGPVVLALASPRVEVFHGGTRHVFEKAQLFGCEAIAGFVVEHRVGSDGEAGFRNEWDTREKVHVLDLLGEPPADLTGVLANIVNDDMAQLSIFVPLGAFWNTLRVAGKDVDSMRNDSVCFGHRCHPNRHFVVLVVDIVGLEGQGARGLGNDIFGFSSDEADHTSFDVESQCAQLSEGSQGRVPGRMGLGIFRSRSGDQRLVVPFQVRSIGFVKMLCSGPDSLEDLSLSSRLGINPRREAVLALSSRPRSSRHCSLRYVVLAGRRSKHLPLGPFVWEARSYGWVWYGPGRPCDVVSG